jgi:dipeptidyl aminopeptidase/acylaminoacyl peptidase
VLRFWLGLAAVFAAVSVAHAAPPVEAYGALPAVDQVSISPSGDQLALVTRIDEDRTLVVVRVGGATEFAGKLGDAKVVKIAWAGEDHVILFTGVTISDPLSSLPKQNMKRAIDVNLKTQQASAVFEKSDKLLHAVFAWFGSAQIDGRWYGYFGGIAEERLLAMTRGGPLYPDLYRLDLETGVIDLIARSRGASSWVVGKDGVVIGHSNYDPATRTTTIYAGVRNDQPLMTRVTADGDISLQGQGRTPGSLVVADQSGDQALLFELRPGGPEGGEPLLRGTTIGETLDDRMTGLLLGYYGFKDGDDLLLDPALQRRAKAAHKAFPEVRSTLIGVGRGLDRMVLMTDGAQDPGTYWLVDIAKKSAVPIGDIRPDIKPTDLGPVRRISYKASDGLALDGILTLPLGSKTKDLPLVVIVHDGPQASAEEVNFDWQAQAFASRGYAVFQPNYRGTLGYGDAFVKAGKGELGRKMQTDVSEGVAALASQGIVDPKRACILGEGYGGYSALAGVTLQKGLYRCAVAVGAPTDLAKFVTWTVPFAGMNPRRAVALRAPIAGSEGGDLPMLSPARLAAKADAPILLIHGADDTVVPIEQSRMMQKALQAAGKPVELVVLEKEDHGLSHEATRQTMLRSAVAFVEKNNPAQ